MAIATELLGWASAMTLLATIGGQVYKQWRTRSVAGVSRWLFIGQLAASAGFFGYSVLLNNWVFAATNLLMFAAALAGAFVDRRNRRLSKPPAREGKLLPSAAP